MEKTLISTLKRVGVLHGPADREIGKVIVQDLKRLGGVRYAIGTDGKALVGERVPSVHKEGLYDIKKTSYEPKMDVKIDNVIPDDLNIYTRLTEFASLERICYCLAHEEAIVDPLKVHTILKFFKNRAHIFIAPRDGFGRPPLIFAESVFVEEAMCEPLKFALLMTEAP